MGCTLYQNCGGCVHREHGLDVYRAQKKKELEELLEKNLGNIQDVWAPPVFLPDGIRRRAAFAFEMKNQELILGFNENQSSRITDVRHCDMLCSKINAVLSDVHALLKNLCSIQACCAKKSKKAHVERMICGDFQILDAENGLDAVLEADIDLTLEHRMEIADFMNTHDAFIRFSFRKKHTRQAEPVIEKTKPFVQMGGTNVFISAGDFLQPSAEGEQALISLVLEYLGETRGKMADLFCGIGTFSYALAKLNKTKVLSVDVSKPLLENFQKSVDAQMISNITIMQKDLFLYPLSAEELENFDVIVIDPPRAGAKALIKELCKVKNEARPQKIVMVSCNPSTFARDAKTLILGGYYLKKVTFVDQFVYSEHSELVALFTNEK